MNQTYYLHVGAPKTGTSYIQHFLAVNAERLAAKGWAYPEDRARSVARAAAGEVLSGNGYPLFQDLRKPGADVARVVADFVAGTVASAGGRHVVASCEQLALLTTPELHEIGAAANQFGYDLRLVFYVRAPVDLALAGIGQMIKRHGHVQSHADTLLNARGRVKELIPAIDFRAMIERYEEAVGRDALILRHYDRSAFLGRSLLADFLAAIGLTMDADFAVPSAEVNPSLSQGEIAFMAAINRFEKGRRLGPMISDALMFARKGFLGSYPDLVAGPPVRLSERDAIHIAEEFEADVAYVRDVYGLPTLTTYTDAIIGPADSGEPPTQTELLAMTLLVEALDRLQRQSAQLDGLAAELARVKASVAGVVEPAQ
ncbi:MAG: hypothetical protein ACWA6X_10685 [Bauldia sp.]